MAEIKKEWKDGERLQILIGIRKVWTYFHQGVQRIESTPNFRSQFREHGGTKDLNQIAVEYIKGVMPFQEYYDIYMNLDYSVSGFGGLSKFQHLDIFNPLWEDDNTVELPEVPASNNLPLSGCEIPWTMEIAGAILKVVPTVTVNEKPWGCLEQDRDAYSVMAENYHTAERKYVFTTPKYDTAVEFAEKLKEDSYIGLLRLAAEYARQAG